MFCLLSLIGDSADMSRPYLCPNCDLTFMVQEIRDYDKEVAFFDNGHALPCKIFKDKGLYAINYGLGPTLKKGLSRRKIDWGELDNIDSVVSYIPEYLHLIYTATVSGFRGRGMYFSIGLKYMLKAVRASEDKALIDAMCSAIRLGGYMALVSFFKT